MCIVLAAAGTVFTLRLARCDGTTRRRPSLDWSDARRRTVIFFFLWYSRNHLPPPSVRLQNNRFVCCVPVGTSGTAEWRHTASAGTATAGIAATTFSRYYCPTRYSLNGWLGNGERRVGSRQVRYGQVTVSICVFVLFFVVRNVALFVRCDETSNGHPAMYSLKNKSTSCVS